MKQKRLLVRLLSHLQPVFSIKRRTIRFFRRPQRCEAGEVLAFMFYQANGTSNIVRRLKQQEKLIDEERVMSKTASLDPATAAAASQAQDPLFSCHANSEPAVINSPQRDPSAVSFTERGVSDDKATKATMGTPTGISQEKLAEISEVSGSLLYSFATFVLCLLYRC